MVQAQVELVKSERLAGFGRHCARMILIGFLVVHFQTGKHGILEAHVHAHQIEADRVGLVRLQRRRYGETCLGVSVQNEDELLLFHGANDERTSLGVRGQILARHNAATARLAQSFLVNFLQNVLCRVVLQDDHTARVRAHNYVVLEREYTIHISIIVLIYFIPFFKLKLISGGKIKI